MNKITNLQSKMFWKFDEIYLTFELIIYHQSTATAGTTTTIETFNGNDQKDQSIG